MSNNIKLYAAYGSNLNLHQMSVRCPTARPVGSGRLDGYQLTFRSVATVEPCEGASVPIAVWEITEHDEDALDRYEGFPRLYRKETVTVTVHGKSLKVMAYLMNGGLPCMPSKFYLEAIAQGYEDVGLDTDFLDGALAHTANKLKRSKTELN